MKTILDTLALEARQRVSAEIASVSLAEMSERALDTSIRAGFLFEQALRAPGLSFICEVKKASPSKGLISPDFPYLDIARDYQLGGAAAISVLTEPAHFLGSDSYLSQISARVAVPILRKDFTVDPYQIYQARVLGASAVLLICSILSDSQLSEYLDLADSLGLSCLTEAHDAEEIDRAVRAGARVIGVNNRNLRDFTIDTTTSATLRTLVPEDRIYVSESGVTEPSDLAAIAQMGADAVLIGEALMTAEHRGRLLRVMRNTAANALPTRKAGASLCPAIKICGISREEDIPVLNETLPEYVGFVFHPFSRRFVQLATAQHLRSLLDPRIITVGVFANSSIVEIIAAVNSGTISMVQLHGGEFNDYVKSLRKALPHIPIIYAFPIHDGASFVYANHVDPEYILFDSFRPGSGISFTWSLLDIVRELPEMPPFFLAGGLNDKTVRKALDLGVYAVDVSSGVESNGVKDPDRIRSFIAAVRTTRDVHNPRKGSE